MIRTFSRGDRVCSNVAGLYMGMPGTIVGKSIVQYNMDTRYSVALDCDKTISFRASQLLEWTDEMQQELYKRQAEEARRHRQPRPNPWTEMKRIRE